MNANPVIIDRIIEAPIQAVWQCWSEPEFVSIWYGPGVETIMHYFDFTEGGYWHEEMRMGENSMHGRSEFAEIIPGRKIVLRQSTADEKGNIIPNPMMPNWPEIIEATIMFTEQDNQTAMHFSWTPHQASETEIETFNQMAPQMSQGWQKGFDILEKEAQKIAS